MSIILNHPHIVYVCFAVMAMITLLFFLYLRKQMKITFTAIFFFSIMLIFLISGIVIFSSPGKYYLSNEEELFLESLDMVMEGYSFEDVVSYYQEDPFGLEESFPLEELPMRFSESIERESILLQWLMVYHERSTLLEQFINDKFNRNEQGG